MKVSIIIPVFNKLDFTKKCLTSVFGCGGKFPFEVIVVDNASSDGTEEHLVSMGGKIRYIKNDKNLGFAKACNQGAKAAKGGYLLFLNNDTEVTDGWMDALVDELDRNGKAAIVGSKLLFPDDRIQHAGIVFGADKLPHHLYYRISREKPFVNKKRNFEAVTAACLMIRKEIFNTVGGFDEAYVNGLEDIDLCLKVRQSGYEIVYCPESVVYHHESVTEGRFSYAEKNVEIFLGRWGEKIAQDDRKYLSEDGNLDQVSQLQYAISQKDGEIGRLTDILTQRDKDIAELSEMRREISLLRKIGYVKIRKTLFTAWKKMFK